MCTPSSAGRLKDFGPIYSTPDPITLNGSRALMEAARPNDTSPVFNRIMSLLKKGGVKFRIHSHPAVCTMEQAHARVPHLCRNLVKTVVFRIKDGNWILAAVRAQDRVDYKKLAGAAGVNRTAVRAVSPELVAEELGFQVGGVGPFPVRDDMRVVVDDHLEGIGNIFCGSGLNTRTVEIDMDDLIEITGARIHPIARK